MAVKGQDLDAGVASARTLGTGANQAAAGDHAHAPEEVSDEQLDETDLVKRVALLEERHRVLVEALLAWGIPLPVEQLLP